MDREFAGRLKRLLDDRIEEARAGLEGAADMRTVIGFQMAVKECRWMLGLIDGMLGSDEEEEFHV